MLTVRVITLKISLIYTILPTTQKRVHEKNKINKKKLNKK